MMRFSVFVVVVCVVAALGEASDPRCTSTSHARHHNLLHTVAEVSASDVGDMDGDGYLDIVYGTDVSTGLDDHIGWIRWHAGRGEFGGSWIVSDALEPVKYLLAVDIDEDGDIDVAFVHNVWGTPIYWLENEGQGDFGIGTPEVLAAETMHVTLGKGSFHFADVNTDGHLDLIYFALSTPYLSLGLGGGNFSFPATTLGSTIVLREWEIADYNGDAFLDIASTQQDAIVVFFADDGSGSSYTTDFVFQMPPGSSDYIRTFAQGDFNGDTYVDLAYSPYNAGTQIIEWLANDGSGTFSVSQTITLSSGAYASDLVAFDLDGANGVDLVRVDWTGAVFSVFNNGAGVFGTPVLSSTTTDRATVAIPCEFEPDGHPDLVIAGKSFVDLRVNDGAGSLDNRVIASGLDRPVAVLPIDLNGDGRVDVAAGSNHHVFVFFNLGGRFGPQVYVDPSNSGYDLAALDADGDDHMDFAAVSLSRLAWYRNTDGLGSMSEAKVIASSISSVKAVVAGDVDGDGADDLVIAAATANGLVLFANNGTGSFDSGTPITSSGHPFDDVALALLSADGLLDLVAASSASDSVFYFRNLGARVFQLNATLTDAADGATAVACGDLDGDALIDVVAASEDDDQIAWFRNTGSGFAAAAVVTLDSSPSGGYSSLWLEDMDLDGDLDILCSGSLDDSIDLFLNLDGHGLFPVEPRIVFSPVDDPRAVIAIDVTGNGLPDVMSGSYYDQRLAWFENSGNDAAFALVEAATITVASRFDMAAGDVTGDGRPDLISSARHVVTLQINDGFGNFPTTAVLARDLVLGWSVSLVDFDQDNDLDIAFCDVSAGKAMWMENKGGTFSPPKVISLGTPALPRRVLGADMDHDGDLDAVVAGDNLFWFRFDGESKSFDPVPVQMTSSFSNYMFWAQVADLDMDGDADVALVNAQRWLGWVENVDGNGTVWAAHNFRVWGTGNLYWSGLGDINGDGCPDLVGSLPSEGVWWWRSACNGSFTPILIDAEYGGWVRVANFFGEDDHVDVMVGVAGSHNEVWMYRNLGGGVFAPRVDVLPNGGMATVADYDGDGRLDVAYDDEVYLQARSPFFGLQPQTITMDLTPQACQQDPFSFLCLVANIGRLSPCTHDTLLLPPGRYGCLADAHFTVTSSLTIGAQLPGTVVFDCRHTSSPVGGVLFRVMPPSAVYETETPPSLTLRDLAIEHLGVGRASLAGAPGLRVEGTGATLRLENVVIRDALSTSVGTLLSDEGVGGAVLVSSGGSLVAVNVSFERCESSNGGGAVAVRGESSAWLRDTNITGCTSGTGGALLAREGGSLVLEATRIAACTASQGAGGALAADPDTRVTVHGGSITGCAAVAGVGGAVVVRPGANVTMFGTHVGGNTALLGGAIASAPAAMDAGAFVASVVDTLLASSPAGIDTPSPGDGVGVAVLTGVHLEGNTGVLYGGALFACEGVVVVTGAGTRWAGNTALRGGALGTAADVFVCALESTALPPGFTPGRAHPEGIPWVRLDADLFAGPLAEAAVNAPVASLEWVSAPQETVMAGDSIGGALSGAAASFRSLDWLGETVSFTDVIASLAHEAVPNLIVGAEATIRVEERVVPVPNILLYLENADVAPPRVPWTISVQQQTATDTMAISSLSGETLLAACAPGFGKQETILPSGDVAVACAACAPGTYSTTLSFDACLLIRDCLENSIDVSPASSLVPECHCKKDYALGGWVQDTLPVCAPCPPGAACAQGLGHPVPLPGFFFVNSSSSFVRCKRESSCVGSDLEEQCNPGYEGYMCNDCQAGYYSNAQQECVRCPKDALQRSWLAAGALLLTLLLAALLIAFTLLRIRRNQAVGPMGAVAMKGGSVQHLTDDSWSSEVSDTVPPVYNSTAMRKRTSPPSLSIALIVFQVIGIIGDQDVKWSRSSKEALTSFNVFNIDSSIFASECALNDFHTKYMVSVLFPICAVMVIFVVLAILKAFAACGCCLRRLRVVTFKALADAAIFTVAPLLFIPMARSTLVLFDCSKLPNGDLVLDQDPSVKCFDSRWWRTSVVGVVGLVLFVCGLPVYCALVLFRHRARLNTDPAVFARFGPLYRLYRFPYWWSGVADLIKRLLIVIAAVFFSQHQLIQIGLLLTTFLTTAMFMLRHQPYFHPAYNSLEAHLTFGLILLLCLGGASYAERSSTTTSHTAIFVMSVSILVLICARVLFALVHDVLSMRRERRDHGAAGRDRVRELTTVWKRHMPDIPHAEAKLLEQTLRRMTEARATEVPTLADDSQTTATGSVSGVSGVVSNSPVSSSQMSSDLSEASLHFA